MQPLMVVGGCGNCDQAHQEGPRCNRRMGTTAGMGVRTCKVSLIKNRPRGPVKAAWTSTPCQQSSIRENVSANGTFASSPSNPLASHARTLPIPFRLRSRDSRQWLVATARSTRAAPRSFRAHPDTSSHFSPMNSSVTSLPVNLFGRGTSKPTACRVSGYGYWGSASSDLQSHLGTTAPCPWPGVATTGDDGTGDNKDSEVEGPPETTSPAPPIAAVGIPCAPPNSSRGFAVGFVVSEVVTERGGETAGKYGHHCP
jgi:hypothetical protein